MKYTYFAFYIKQKQYKSNKPEATKCLHIKVSNLVKCEIVPTERKMLRQSLLSIRPKIKYLK